MSDSPHTTPADGREELIALLTRAGHSPEQALRTISQADLLVKRLPPRPHALKQGN
jgi:hypothetical protein